MGNFSDATSSRWLAAVGCIFGIPPPSPFSAYRSLRCLPKQDFRPSSLGRSVVRSSQSLQIFTNPFHRLRILGIGSKRFCPSARLRFTARIRRPSHLGKRTSPTEPHAISYELQLGNEAVASVVPSESSPNLEGGASLPPITGHV